MLFIGFVLVLFISACGGQSPEEKIYGHLEEAVELEGEFVSQQTVITNLEKQEKEKFDQILELKMDDIEKIQKLAKEALELTDQRAEELEIEKASMDKSKEEFEKIAKSLEKIEDETVKNKAEELYDVMIDRYDAYDKIYEAYLASLKEEQVLYEMFQNEELTQEDYTAQITKVNDSYTVILDENKRFNEDTSLYNEYKKEFYDLANFNVVYNEEDETNEANNDNETNDNKEE